MAIGPLWVVVGLVGLWALLFLPNLRTSPAWYGDEGEWMEKCWTFSHGQPSVGPIVNDFVFPYPYPPFYMLVNGALLRVFGYDVLVGRALGAVTALGAAALLVWIGTRLRDREFGVVCAVAFLVYSETNINFRWVRSHPLAGTLALACVGFLVRYLQEKRLRDALLAGLLCALATGTNYFAVPLIAGVIGTVAVANARDWRQARAWGHVAGAGALAGAYGLGFVLWYVLAQPGGWDQLLAQAGRLASVASNEVRPTGWGEVARFFQNVWTLGFLTPTHGPPPAWDGRDWWLRVATVGFLFLPTRAWRFRLWLPVWLLVLMYGVFQKLNNVPLFFYPAMMFVPLLAVGFAGVLTWAGEGLRKLGATGLRLLPAVIVLALIGLPSLGRAWTHWDTKIDLWAQGSVAEAEAAMRYVNERTTATDVVVVPKQIYWLVKRGRPSMLTWCARYNGVVNDMPVPVEIPRELYWFDCRLENTRFVVLASGVEQATRRPVGIDLVYSQGLKGVPEVVAQMRREQWPVVFSGGHPVAYATTATGGSWPVVVDGEYLVFENPRFREADERKGE